MSFPYLSDVIKALTGLDVPLPIATFGLMVAAAMLAGAACLRTELRRLHQEGRLGMARRKTTDAKGTITGVFIAIEEWKRLQKQYGISEQAPADSGAQLQQELGEALRKAKQNEESEN